MGNFNIKDILLDVIGYKGLPYPGVWLPAADRSESGDGYEYSIWMPTRSFLYI